MRVAFYAPLKSPENPVPSGDRLMARQIMAALEHGGHDVELASDLRAWTRTPDFDALQDLKDSAADETARLLARWTQPDALRPDVWLTYHNYYRAPDLIGPEVAQALAIPYVQIESSFAGKRRKDEWANWNAASEVAIRRGTRHLYFTDVDREGLARLVSPDRLVAFPPFIRTGNFAADRNNGAGPVRLITVAMMRARAKCDSYRLLADALGTIREDDWTLTIVGDGPERESVAAMFASFDADRVTFTGELDEAGVADALCRSDVFVWPGVGEAYGLVYLEAQAAGLPVVALERAPAHAVIKSGTTGVLTGETPAAYGEAIADLIADAQQRDALGKAARTFVHGERDIASAATRLNSVITGLERSSVGAEQAVPDMPLSHAALTRAGEVGPTVPVWLRDDDAVAPTLSLDRLLGLSERYGMPVMLAVIPKFATGALATRLQDEGRVCVATHGHAHINRAAVGTKSSEFGAERTASDISSELTAGRARLSSMFGSTAVDMFVPPWNRVADVWHDRIEDAGFAAISSFGAGSESQGDGVAHLPTHVDIMDWSQRAGRDAADVDAALAQEIERVMADPHAAPIGILTHHLVHDDTAWIVLEAVAALVSGHAASRWINIRDVI